MADTTYEAPVFPPDDAPSFIVERGDTCYPALLGMTVSPPERLFGYGDPSVLGSGGLAIVGARRATPYGLDCARVFASRAAQAGVTIISGGAVGCDQEAARAALDSGGKSIAVLGGGADVIYPSNAAGLFQRIVENGGAVISENTWGAPPLRPYFVKRNRIIAGMASATLIVEAGLPSGTFSTADSALNAGRDVFVVPGCINSPQSKGSNRLLYQGARPIVDMGSFDDAIQDIFGTLMLVDDSHDICDTGELGNEKTVIYEILAARPMRLDELAMCVDCDRSRFLALVAECEAYGVIEKGRDGRYFASMR